MNHPDLENVFPAAENVFPDVLPYAERQGLDAVRSSGKKGVRRDLRARLLALPYRSFLIVIAQLLERQGSQNIHLLGREGFVGRNRSGGWDLEAALPLFQGFAHGQPGVRCIIQAKQFGDLAVQQRTVDELRGCCLRAGAGRGLLITTSRFSPVAQRAAATSALAPIMLIDGDHLVDLLIQHELGVARSHSGKWQLDPKFFHSLVSKEASFSEGKTKALTPAAPHKQQNTGRGPVVEPRKALAGPGPIDSPTQPTVLHFSITLDGRPNKTRRWTNKQ